MPGLEKKPAVLGGKPAFSKIFPFNQPTIPELGELTDQLKDIFSSKMITNAKYVREFEKNAAKYLGVKHAVAVSCCTSGLLLVLKALELKGEVIVPSFTFSATVQSLVWNNLKPVFVDCDPKSFNIDAKLVESLITPKTSAIMAVHIFGMPADVGALSKIAKMHGLKLIFDAAHGFGAKYDGKLVGGFGDAEIFSLSPTKILTAGEGGIVATNDDVLAGNIRIGRDYANQGDYNCQFAGLSARMAEFNAILGLKNLETIEEKVARRNEIADVYKENLKGLPGISFQETTPGSRCSYKDVSILIDPKKFGLTRDVLAQCLDKENIKTKKYYYPPVHHQKFITDMFKADESKLKVTNYVSQNILSLPILTHMKDKDITAICGAIRNIYKYRNEI